MPSRNDHNDRLDAPCDPLQVRRLFQQKPVAGTVLPTPTND
ncbi:hypothetical protein [Pseudomonas fluorescens]|uniref:Uncharacterized protein n=1 Tax=Pseudomonas fluorescens TaxID=294 RepID=A0A5E6ZQ17_PSEFL|nr:hypothetical protein [Pseudomonas fluorescens]VVN66057.1 hypothetical protein PS710_00107 [Pseudomonas fluorescens]